MHIIRQRMYDRANLGPYSQAILTDLEYHTGSSISVFSTITVLDELQDTMSEIRNSHPTAKLLLGGDFASPGIN